MKNDVQQKTNLTLEERIIKLEKQVDQLTEQVNLLTNKMEKPNARGAGRKKGVKVIENKKKVRKLLEEGKSRDEILKEMGISMVTYYRYLRDDKEDIAKSLFGSMSDLDAKE